MAEVVGIDAFLARAFERYCEAKRRFDHEPTFANIEACRKAYQAYVRIGLSPEARDRLERPVAVREGAR